MIKIEICKQSNFVPESHSRCLNRNAMQIYLLCAIIAALALPLSAAEEVTFTCGPPPVLPHASSSPILGDESPTGTLVTYSCQFGYVIDGNKRTSRCLLTQNGSLARWTDPQISCIPRSCGDPGFLEHGRLIGTLYTFPNLVSFECDDGYRLVGNKQRYCLASGSWSGRLPRCESITCDPPKDPENGHVTYTSLNYLSRLQLECNKGYRPDDDAPVYCTSDGTWSGTDTQCIEATCNVPEKPEHGNVELIGSTPRAGTMAVFSCSASRTLYGPTTSKCLDNGQWTFPTPQCLEPCSIPVVKNGRIGRYVTRRFNNNLSFSEIAVGSRIEDNEKLFLHCDVGFNPLGLTDNWQQRVSCSSGKWSQEPFCEPKRCLEKYPEVPNATPVRGNRTHGGTIEYACFPNYKKTKYGNVNCHYGEWRGEKPVCTDTRCRVADMGFYGLEKGNTEFYRDGDYYEVICDQGYQLASGHIGRLKCDDGVWKGAISPCVAASCTQLPPRIDHGRAEVTSTSHSAYTTYVCDKSYMLIESNKVQCLFGQWTGQPPKCANSGCFLEDLKYKANVSPATKSFTSSGGILTVHCNEGYGPTSPLPMCYNAVWSRNGQSVCKEKDCYVQWIANGEIKEQILGRKWFNVLAFRYERPVEYKKVPFGTTPSRSAKLFLVCHQGYTFQGKGIPGSEIMCSEGRWSPDPVCLRNGMKYVPTTKKPITTTKKITTTFSRITTTPTPIRMRSTTTSSPANDLEEKKEITLPIIESTTVEDCYCEYTLDDDNVVAYTDGEILKVYDRVKNTSVVEFRCKQIGFQHLVGPEKLMCNGCQSWITNDFPVCDNPKQGDVVIVYDSEVNVSMKGVLEVLRGQNVRLSCIALEEPQYPKWTVPDETGIDVVPERLERQNDYLYISHLDILSPTYENEGNYSCAVEKYPPMTLELRVVDRDVQCPKFLDDEELAVLYSEEETRVGSRASFSCRRHAYRLTETEDSICLRTGEWSRAPPQCGPITCEKLEDTDLMQVSYSDDQNVGSFANFHCFAPGRPEGVGRTRCLDNGQWAQEPPTCRTTPCLVKSLLSAVPKGVIPNIHVDVDSTMPYNSTVELLCGDNLALKGNSMAKCGKDGLWIVEEVQCVPGCLPFMTTSSSKLIITPEKEVYKIGDTVTFACIPGYNLDDEVQQTMCLGTRWSENTLPECVESYNDDT